MNVHLVEYICTIDKVLLYILKIICSYLSQNPPRLSDEEPKGENQTLEGILLPRGDIFLRNNLD